ncbi:MAG: FG-GAP-like repeat-containing protein [Planctomycetaceae bacterium]
MTRLARVSFAIARGWIGAICCLSFIGCHQEDSGPSVSELVRRQQQREKEASASAKSPQERLRLAQTHFANGNPVNAQVELRPLLIAQPADSRVLLLAAQCADATGQRPDAYHLLESISDTDKEALADALWLAAQWLAEDNRYDAAQQKLERLLELQINPNRVHRRLAQWLNNQGRRHEAATHLRALARSGDISEKELFAMNTYGDAFIDESQPLRRVSQGLRPAALADARELRSKGDLESARELIEQLADAFPASTPIAAFRGRIYAELQDDRLLREWMAELPSNVDREPEYWSAMGSWLQRSGRHREAVRCFGEAVLRDETDRFSYLALARSMKVLGDQPVAAEAMQRFTLLEEAATITRKIGRAPGSHQDLLRMAEILEHLKRPWEASGWRSVAESTYRTEARQGKNLRKNADAVRDREDSAVKAHFLTCGIDLSDWPLPALEPMRITDTTPPKLPKDAANGTRLALHDVANKAQLAFQYDNGDDPTDDSLLLHQMTGGGIGVIDFDRDGWPDLYFTQAGGDAFNSEGSKPNQLFRNMAGEEFKDVTNSASTGDRGYGQGVAVADLNQDGFSDLVLANIGSNVIYMNNGDGTFSHRALGAAGDVGAWTTSVACGDLSGDGLPEILEVNYVDDPTAMTIACTPDRDICNPSVFRSASDQVWQVTADGTLRPWDGCQNLSDRPNYGFAAVIANFDGVAGNDIFIANDTGHNHFWASQQGDSKASHILREVAHVLGCSSGLLGQQQGCMGIAYGDFDRNACLDLHVTNYWDQPADLYLQNTAGLFVNASLNLGIYEKSRATVGWGTQAADFDRDGWLDLAVLNGHLIDHRHRGQPYKMRPQMFSGAADGFHFLEPVADYWMTPTLGRCMVTLDWNADGRPDLATGHLDVPTALLQNETEPGNYIQFELVGSASERDAVGAKLTLTCGDEFWTSWVVGGHGFLCSNEQVVDFGISDHLNIDQLKVSWPSGSEQTFSSLAANRRYVIVEGEDDAFAQK